MVDGRLLEPSHQPQGRGSPAGGLAAVFQSPAGGGASRFNTVTWFRNSERETPLASTVSPVALAEDQLQQRGGREGLCPVGRHVQTQLMGAPPLPPPPSARSGSIHPRCAGLEPRGVLPPLDLRGLPQPGRAAVEGRVLYFMSYSCSHCRFRKALQLASSKTGDAVPHLFTFPLEWSSIHVSCYQPFISCFTSEGFPQCLGFV